MYRQININKVAERCSFNTVAGIMGCAIKRLSPFYKTSNLAQVSIPLPVLWDAQWRTEIHQDYLEAIGFNTVAGIMGCAIELMNIKPFSFGMFQYRCRYYGMRNSL